MADTVKQISLTGGAVQDYNFMKGGGKKRRGGRTRKNREEDEQIGGDSPMDPEIPLRQINTSRAANLSRQINFTKVGGGTQPIDDQTQTTGRQEAVQHRVTPGITAPGTVPQNAGALTVLPAISAQLKAGTAPVTQGGGKKKIVLTPKKHKSSLLLAPPTSQKKLVMKQKSSVNKTRKIKVQLANMKKRVTTAKIIHKDSKEKSIEEIRKLLEESKLIKPAKEGKKVPEDILRNIYKDYLILRNKAL